MQIYRYFTLTLTCDIISFFIILLVTHLCDSFFPIDYFRHISEHRFAISKNLSRKRRRSIVCEKENNIQTVSISELVSVSHLNPKTALGEFRFG